MSSPVFVTPDQTWYQVSWWHTSISTSIVILMYLFSYFVHLYFSCCCCWVFLYHIIARSFLLDYYTHSFILHMLSVSCILVMCSFFLEVKKVISVCLSFKFFKLVDSHSNSLILLSKRDPDSLSTSATFRPLHKHSFVPLKDLFTHLLLP